MITSELYDGNCFITVESKIQMFAGDPGTDAATTQSLNDKELKTHIVELIKIWKEMQKQKEIIKPVKAKKVSKSKKV